MPAFVSAAPRPPTPQAPAFPARRVLIGVAGSIAAIAVPPSIMFLRHVAGVEVRAVLTRSAAELVSIKSIAVATSHPVLLDEPERVNEPAVAHLDLTRWADLLLIMPATANLLGKAAAGIADDALTTCILAATSPVVFVPSMNDAMWAKPAVQRNIATLKVDGYGVIPPAIGLAAVDGKCGEGAMPDIMAVLRWTRRFLNTEAVASDSPQASSPIQG